MIEAGSSGRRSPPECGRASPRPASAPASRASPAPEEIRALPRGAKRADKASRFRAAAAESWFRHRRIVSSKLGRGSVSSAVARNRNAARRSGRSPCSQPLRASAGPAPARPSPPVFAPAASLPPTNPRSVAAASCSIQESKKSRAAATRFSNSSLPLCRIIESGSSPAGISATRTIKIVLQEARRANAPPPFGPRRRRRNKERLRSRIVSESAPDSP